MMRRSRNRASSRGTSRRGFVLLGVLWVVVGAIALGVGLSLTANQSVDAAQNRTDILRSQWRAEGCAERARAAVHEGFRAAAPTAPGTTRIWRSMDSVVASSSLVAGCDLSLEPGGTRIDVNGDSTTLMRGLLLALGIDRDRADSLVEALEDWRDEDDTPRSKGAEREWYARHHRAIPSNTAIAAVAELHRVRGFETLDALDTLVGTEPDRLLLARAPPAVLLALPGLGTEAVARIMERRALGRSIAELAELSELLSPPARQALLAHYAELVRQTTGSPETWTIRSRASAGRRGVIATIEVRLVHAGSRAAVVRRTTWP